MTDDWKGASLISAKPKSLDERRSLTISQAHSLSAEQRRKAGTNQSRCGGPWAKAITRHFKSGGQYSVRP